MTDTPFLSLCLIVKNEEKNIERLLDSVDVKEANSAAPAFDEIIIVDTGSTDATRDLVAKRFGLEWPAPQDTPQGVELDVVEPTRGVRIVLAHFKWIDDFAKARQYSFELATGRWRMFLDADDTFKSDRLKIALRTVEKDAPVCNVFPFKYIYSSGTEQPVTYRCVRWDDGFKWQRPIHEMLVALPGNQRRVANVKAFTVVHHKDEVGLDNSSERNYIIAKRVYDDPSTPAPDRAEMAYFMSNHLRKLPGHLDEALALLEETWLSYRGTNFGMFARFDSVIIEMTRGNLQDAISLAADIEAFSPEFDAGLLLMGCLHVKKGDWQRAASFFDTARSRPPYPAVNVDEVWFSKGLAPASAVLAYTELDRLTDAAEAMARVDMKQARHPYVLDTFRLAQRKLARKVGLRRLMDLVDYLVWDTEAPKAVRLLSSDCLPAAIADHPHVQERRRELTEKLKHFYGTWDDYKEAYASIPEDKYHTEAHNKASIRLSSRYDYVLAAAEGQSNRARAEGRPCRVLAIGFQDGNIEQDVLEKFDNVLLTVADVAPQASEGLANLRARFPGRVESHAIERDAFDWLPPKMVGKFDLVTLLEVIEHVPGEDGDVGALTVLRRAVTPETGSILVSTPVADRWVESYLTDPVAGPKWYGHVRAHNAESFHKMLRGLRLKGTLVEGWDGTLVADVSYSATEPKVGWDIAIVVPGTPKPFDAFSHLRGFTGGSEEAVIYLSQALADLGHRVTVYTPEYTPEDSNFIRAHMGVMWKDIGEMDFFGAKHDSVLFWRCPQLVSQLRAAPYLKVLWLHDYEYQAKASDYEAADAVVTLSDAHSRAIEECDGFKGPFHKAANGIDPEMFPSLLGNERDPKKVIYVSSPDRGLHRILEEWPAIREEVPDATLDIYYDWTQFAKIQPEFCEMLTRAVDNLKGSGVRHLGGVDQVTLTEAMRKASVWLYPNDGKIETFCISALRAQATGLTIIASDAGALPEVILDNRDLIPEEMLDTEEGRRILRIRTVEALNDPESEDVREKRRTAVLEMFSWKNVARMFEKVL